MTSPSSKLKAVDSTDILSPDELSTINTAYDLSEPEGKFFKGRHGVTHYIVDSAAESGKGTLVCTHGLGNSMDEFIGISKLLVQEGFTVLRYDYFGHGYSKYGGKDIWVKYSPDIFVDQLEDVLNFVSGEEIEKVIGFIGHGTGGVVGIYAMDRWGMLNERPISKYVLISPGIWAKKPFEARVTDKIPTATRYLMKHVKPLRNLIGDSFLKAGRSMFARDAKRKNYIYPDQQKNYSQRIRRLFGKVKGVKAHPFLAAAIFGINGSTLRGDLLPMHRNILTGVLSTQGSTVDVLCLWGKKDVTVPYNLYSKTAQEWDQKYSNFTIQTLENGHEVLYEDSAAVSSHVLSFLN